MNQNRINYIPYVLILQIFVFGIQAWAQPLASTRQIIGEVVVFQDLKDEKLFYYAPGGLSLAVGVDGKPELQLLQMRYTGTKLSSATGEKRFTNVLQFGVVMKGVAYAELAAVKKELGRGISLRPFPVKNIDAQLIIPGNIASDKSVLLQGDVSTQSRAENQESDRGSYWTERTFTVRLDNSSAQLLWEQLENSRLAISVGYSFFGEFIEYIPAELTTSESYELQGVNEELDEEPAATVASIKTGTISVAIDTKKWPDLIRKIDINESLPPAYPTLEIKCFDFQDQIDPDILLKKVTLKATSVNGQPIKLPTVRFSKSQPDLHSHQIKSAYAITLSKPLYYKTTTLRKDGSNTTIPWVKTTSWHELIDITTKSEAQNLVKETIDFEWDTLAINEAGYQSAHLYLEYTIGEHSQKQKITIYPNQLQIQQLKVRRNKDDLSRFRIIWKHKNGTKIVGRKTIVREDYYFLTLPK